MTHRGRGGVLTVCAALAALGLSVPFADVAWASEPATRRSLLPQPEPVAAPGNVIAWPVDPMSIQTRPGDEFNVPLPGETGADLARVVVVRVELSGENWVTVSGVIAGDPSSSVVLARRGDALVGSVHSLARGAFEIRGLLDADRQTFGHLSGARHLVARVDSDTGRCAATAEHEVAVPGEMAPADRGAGNARVSVLFLYTEAARTGRGGQAQIDALIDTAIAQANSAYTASNATIRMVEAGRSVVTYAETGNSSTDLASLRSTTDSVLNEAHCLRDAYGADFVALITDTASSGVCGIGYIMTNVSTGFNTSAFSVTRASCVSGYTLVHELGHNMGCAHDRANAGAASHPFAYGYRTPDNVYRTIMAYAPGTRVGRFSNPDVIYNGYVMGIAMTEPEPTNNALALSLNGPTMAQFRADTLLSIGDFNRDRLVSVQDIFSFIAAWFGGATSADVNGSGVVSVEDLFAFLSAWFGAVPPAC